MTLREYKSLCELHPKKIVSRDKRNQQKHIAFNENLSEVYHYRIDGEIITTGLRCDFLLLNEDKRNAYLIELKGSDLGHAIDQLEATNKVLKEKYFNEYKKWTIMYRVVLNKSRTHAIESTKVKKFKNLHKERFVYKSNVIEEKI